MVDVCVDGKDSAIRGRCEGSSRAESLLIEA
jgi:hypothetical protein